MAATEKTIKGITITRYTRFPSRQTFFIKVERMFLNVLLFTVDLFSSVAEVRKKGVEG